MLCLHHQQESSTGGCHATPQGVQLLHAQQWQVRPWQVQQWQVQQWQVQSWQLQQWQVQPSRLAWQGCQASTPAACHLQAQLVQPLHNGLQGLLRGSCNSLHAVLLQARLTEAGRLGSHSWCRTGRQTSCRQLLLQEVGPDCLVLTRDGPSRAGSAAQPGQHGSAASYVPMAGCQRTALLHGGGYFQPVTWLLSASSFMVKYSKSTSAGKCRRCCIQSGRSFQTVMDNLIHDKHVTKRPENELEHHPVLFCAACPAAAISRKSKAALPLQDVASRT